VGTALTIIPTINQDDYVSVQILQEVNSLTNQVIDETLYAALVIMVMASTFIAPLWLKALYRHP